MKLSATLVPDWPKLAWLAHFEGDGSEIALQHGTGVEVGDDWFVEAVWDGPFSQLDFDQTDLVFGSGGRQRDNRWTFVSSGTMLDRLHSHRCGDEYYVSNSLACLTSCLNAVVDPHSQAYFQFFESCICGIGNYEPTLATSAGDVRLTYFRNLSFDGLELQEVDKPPSRRDFSTFEGYEAFLTDSMEAIGANLSSSDRTFPYKTIASISTGYDSPAVATLARHAGLEETFSIVDARGGANDDGSEIARRLGLKPVSIKRDLWRSADNLAIDVTRFVASDAKGEDVYFAAASDLLERRVVFTGYRGNGVWKPTEDDRSNLSRTDQSGLSHTEARLHGQYLHVPVPFFGARQENEIRSIGRSSELDAWRLGGTYDEPVCRRIVEKAGVPRELFGQEKKAASVLLFDRTSFLPPDSQASFAQWCSDHQIGQRSSRERLTTTANTLMRAHGGKVLEVAQRALRRLPRVEHLPVLSRLASSGRIEEIARYEPEFDHLFPWALAETQQTYR